jgi:polyhydroxyalkanoate synthesis repressor PhaR
MSQPTEAGGTGQDATRGGAAVKTTKIIKRYQNRKLYDTEASTYVTLDDITQMIRDGEDVKVIDNKTKRDLTAVTLAQIIFEEQKKHREILSLASLKRIIQSGGESISDFIEKRIAPGIGALQQGHKELEQKIEGLIALGKLPADDARHLMRDFLATSQGRIDELQRMIDGRVRGMLDRMRPAGGLPDRLRELEARVRDLEAELEAERTKAQKAAGRRVKGREVQA